MMRTTPRTQRGRATRDRIVDCAARLMRNRGVRATGLDEICREARVSKSQLYHYFSNKDALTCAVVARQTEGVLSAQMPNLVTLDSWQAIAAWFDRLVALQERNGCVGGCPIGSLANELADHSASARPALAASFEDWQSYLVRGLERMRAAHKLSGQADSRALALATMASIQGGLLLTRTHRSSQPLRVALGAALAYLKTYSTGVET